MNVSGVSAYQPYVDKITSQLNSQTAAAQQSIDALHRLSASYEVKISDYGMIQSDLYNLQSAVQKLSGPDALSFYSAKSTDATVLSAFAQKNAQPGTYSVEVSQLAQGETLVSAPQQSTSAAIGTGAPSVITFQFANGSRQQLTIDQGNNFLQGIAGSINQADIGITASVQFNGSAFQLVLNGPSGSTNSFSVGVSGDDAISRLLSYSNGSSNNAMTQVSAAQDAQGSVNGTPFTSNSNLVSGVAGGLTLSLSKTGRADVTVATDIAQITGAVQSFVDTYNRVWSDLVSSGAGAVSGDRTLSAIGSQLSGSVAGGQSGSGTSYGPLQQIGISMNNDGTLAFDAQAFQDAYAQNPAGVARLFSDNGNGLADQIATRLQDVLQPGGGLSSSIDQLLTKMQGNEQAERSIEYNSMQDMESSAHQYAQKLSMMIVADIVNRFMQNATAQPGTSTEKTLGLWESAGLEAGSRSAVSAAQPNALSGVSGLGSLMNNLMPQNNGSQTALSAGTQA